LVKAGSAAPGPGVDRLGQAVIDPTANVLQLVEAAIARQDDLCKAESRRLEDLLQLRAFYDAELRRAESARIDAIRSVDTASVTRAAEVAAAQAEALRNQVSSAAQAATIALSAALEPIQKDIADLRRVQYEQQGQKSAVVEQKSSVSDARLLILGLLGAAIAAAAIIAPHIH
jgi:hypothetical protein